MSLLERWLWPPRTIGCSDTKRSTVSDELRLLSGDRRQYETAMSIVLGDSWQKVPVRNMMGLINMRFGGTPIDYKNVEVAPILHLMKSYVDDLSKDQVDFLRANDHLPRSKREGEIWMDQDELVAYTREQEDVIYKKKMDYFITMNGIVAAYTQSLGPQAQAKVKKPFKFSMVHMIILAAIILGLVMLIIL